MLDTFATGSARTPYVSAFFDLHFLYLDSQRIVNESFSSRSEELLKLQYYKVVTQKNRFVQ